MLRVAQHDNVILDFGFSIAGLRSQKAEMDHG
jgi:hypothetical protein